MRNFLITLVSLLVAMSATAQIGDHRSELSLGVNGGYVMSNVGFNPTVPQSTLGGITGGVTVRYTCEKYFNSICALVAELNYIQTGWKEDILNSDDLPVVNPLTGQPEQYERRINYLQLPLMARMGWGRERKGFQFFFQVGPQIGLYLSDKSTANFAHADRNQAERIGAQRDAVHDTLAIQRKFDYGIAGGLGLEYSHPRVGHFILEGRYYYGLGDIFNNSKRDYFGRSNLGNIVIKLTYLCDILKSNNSKIK